MIILKKLKIAILLSLLIVSFDNVVLSNAVGFEGKIHKNIYVRDIDISNLTREEAKNKINKIIESNNSFIFTPKFCKTGSRSHCRSYSAKSRLCVRYLAHGFAEFF